MPEQLQPTFDKLNDFAAGFYWMLPNLALAAVVAVLAIMAGALGRRVVGSVFHRRGNEDLGLLLGGFVRWAILLLGLLIMATVVFPSVKPADLLATFGIGSVAIGFAFKDILQNWLSGLLILYRRPFRPGDQIVSGTFEGTVEAIEARATLLRTYDGQRIVIPNSDIYTRAVTVRTAFAQRRSEYDVGIGYGEDAGRVCAIILKALDRVEGVAQDPSPEAIPWSLDPSSFAIRVRWWTDPHQLAVVVGRGRVMAAVRRALADAGVDMPFPTRTVLLHDRTETGDDCSQPVGRSHPNARTGAPVTPTE